MRVRVQFNQSINQTSSIWIQISIRACHDDIYNCECSTDGRLLGVCFVSTVFLHRKQALVYATHSVLSSGPQR